MDKKQTIKIMALHTTKHVTPIFSLNLPKTNRFIIQRLHSAAV